MLTLSRYPAKPLSYKEINRLWQTMQPQTGISQAVADEWIKKVEFLDRVSKQNNVVVFLWNSFTNRFIYMSDKVKILSGMDPALYTNENGVEFSISRAHPDQLQAALLFNQAGLEFMEANKTNIKDVRISMNLLYRNALDEYIQCMQQTSALEVDESGKPSLLISFVHYTGHIKKPETIDYVFAVKNNIGICNYDKDKKSLGPMQTFSAQEKKIIQLLSRGLDTKAIAKQLFISEHTVSSHRRNLIKKTNCIDSTGVVAFSRLINLI